MLAQVWQELDYFLTSAVSQGAPTSNIVNARRNLEHSPFMLFLYLWNKFITAVTAMFSFCTIHSELPCINGNICIWPISAETCSVIIKFVA
jgi:hypothetical protein